MSAMVRNVGFGITVIAALALSACGSQSVGTAASDSSSRPAASAVATAEASSLKIASWGPDNTKAGVAFNKQPDGSAALWIRVNQSLAGDVAAVAFSGVLLQGNISGNLVTAAVPASLYANPGTYSVRVIAHKGEHTAQSNDVKFTVK